MITKTIDQEIEALNKALPILEKKLKDEKWRMEMIESLEFAEMIFTLKSTLSRLQKLNAKPQQITLF